MNKKVRFKKEVKNPNVTIKCKCCGHRNIKPLIRQMFKCSKCCLNFCVQCFLYNRSPQVCVNCNECHDDPSTLLELWTKISLNVTEAIP